MADVMRDRDTADQASILTSPVLSRPSSLFGFLQALEPRDRANRIWLFFSGAGTALFGSLISVVLWWAFVWAIVTPVIRRTVISRDGPLMAIALACGLYAVVKIGATLVHGGLEDMPGMAHTLVFFAPLLVGSRLRYTRPETVIDCFVLSCGFAAILALPVAAYETVWLGERATAFCGNPGVFAAMALLFGSIGALNAASSRTARRWLGVASYLAMVFCVIASGMRTFWLVLPVATLIVGWTIARAMPRGMFLAGLSASLLVVATGLMLAYTPVSDRIGAINRDLAQIRETGSYDSSTGRRLMMWQAGWEAFRDAPLAGYGVAGRMDAIRVRVEPDQHNLVAHTHPHNGYLAALLDAGVAGLAALLAVLAIPVVIAIRSARDSAWGLRVAIGSLLTSTYAFSGLPGIIFEHDLMNSAFVVTLTVLGAAIPIAEKAREPRKFGEA